MNMNLARGEIDSSKILKTEGNESEGNFNYN